MKTVKGLKRVLALALALLIVAAQVPAAMAEEYTITPDGYVTGLSHTTANSGDTVSFGVTAREGYTVEAVNVMNGDAPVETREENGSYSFAMPEGNVTISVVWKLGGQYYTVDAGQGYAANNAVWYRAESITVTPQSPAVEISDNVGGPYSGSVTFDQEGVHSFYLSDGQGVHSDAIYVGLDRTAPTNISVTYDNGAALDGSSKIVPPGSNFTVTATDAGSGIGEIKYYYAKDTLSIDDKAALEALIGDNWQAYSGAGTFPGESGDYNLVVRVTDNLGNRDYSRYLFAVDNYAPVLNITVPDTNIPDTFRKEGETYYVLSNEANDDKSFHIKVEYMDDISEKPRKDLNPTIEVDGKKISVITDYTLGKWDKDKEHEGRWVCYLSFNKIGDMKQGVYSVTAKAEDNAGHISEVAVAPTIILSRGTPAYNISYSGYAGYDGADANENGGYSTAEGATDEVKADTEKERNEFTSEKVFYINGTQNMEITFSNIDLVEEDKTEVTVDGKPSDETGYVTVEEGKVTLNGETAPEGEYVITMTATGINQKTVIMSVKVVVDKTPPVTDGLTAVAYDEADSPERSPIDDGQWTNKNNIAFTLSGISDGEDHELPKNCVTAEGIDDPQLSDGTWTGTVSGEQNKKYTITVTDKAGNPAIEEFTARIDRTEPDKKNAKITAQGYSSDGAMIVDQFTFGVFHHDHDKLVVEISDKMPGSADDDKYDADADRASGIASVEYYILAAPSDELKDNIAAKGEEAEQAIDDYAKTIGETEWTSCNLQGNVFATEAIESTQQYIVFFRVKDYAANFNYLSRGIIVTNGEAPTISFGETGDKVTLDDGRVIYTGPVSVTATVTEPNSGVDESGLYAGITKATYTVCRGLEVLASETFVDIANEGSLHEQGLPEVSKTIVLDKDENGALIDASNISILIVVEDAAGYTYQFPSDIFNIDRTAPVVTVDFDGEPNSPGYYGKVRTATIRIKDSNLDLSSIVIDTSEDISAWTPSETDAYGIVTYTATVTFNEGIHHLAINNVADLTGVKVTDEDVDYGGVTDQGYFIVDTTPPAAAITFNRRDGRAFGEYNNANVVMNVSVSEQNFDAARVALSVNGAVLPLQWTSNGASHTASHTFTNEVPYEVGMTVTDLAGHTTRVEGEKFVIDMTRPGIDISGVEDQTAYNAESVIPVVQVTDTNYAEYGVDIDLIGANGGIASYKEGNIADGQQFTFDNIEDDDLYTLVVRATDEADNQSEMTVQFSVNRNGSVFTGGEEIAKAMENGTPCFRTDNLPPIVVIETNVDIVESAKLYLTKDNTNIDLTEGVDYTIKRVDVNGGWSQYVYTLNKNLFVEDGVYRVSLVTKDAAGNAKNAESVVEFIVDNTKPVLFVADLESGGVYSEETKHVVFSPSDNLILSEVQVFIDGAEAALWEAEEVSNMLREGEEFAFDISESNARRTVQIVCVDAAGNENDDQLFENILVTSNAFVRFYNNKIVFFGAIAAVIVLGGGLWLALARRKSKQEV